MKRVAYVMSRFPRITETFVLYEILELEKLGFNVEVFPLLRERSPIVHPEARTLVETACHQQLLSRAVLAANLHYLWRRPRAYLGALASALAATWGSANFFLGALIFFPKSAWMAREMQRRGVEHLHAHFANHPATAAFIIHRLTGIPWSFTAHGSDIHVEQRGLGPKFAEAAFVVTVSQYNRSFLMERVGPRVASKLHVIHCGIDPAAFPAGPPRAESTGVLRILCVASLRAVKGHRHLIEACRLLRQRGVEFRCDLVGDGPLRREVTWQIESAGLRDTVRLHGDLARPAVLEMLRGADVVVLASVLDRQGRREGIPVSLMEAMAAGCAVVASDLSGIPELIEHGISGLLVPPGDTEAIAAAIADLAAAPQTRRRLGRAAREMVLERFNLAAGAVRLGGLMRRSPGTTAPQPERRSSMGLLHRLRRRIAAGIGREYAIRFRLLRSSLSPKSRRAERHAGVLLISYPKCGRTWLTMLVARAMASHYGVKDADYLENDVLGGAVPGAPHIRISHDDNPHWRTAGRLRKSKRRYRDKKILLLVRDPRDVVVSMYFERNRRERAYSGTLEQFLRERKGSLDTILAYYNIWAAGRATPRGFCMVRYEDLQADAAGQLKRILRFAGVEKISDDHVEEAVRFASFESMRAMETGNALPSGRLRPRDPNDAESFKTRKGKVGGYVDYLGPQEIAWVEQKIRATLDPIYGYGDPAAPRADPRVELMVAGGLPASHGNAAR